MSDKNKDTITIPKGGRPAGSKDQTTPAAFVRRFKGKTMHNISKLLDAEDKDTTLKVMSMIYGRNLPAPPISLCKVTDAETAKRALAQLVDLTARGMVPGEHSDRLMGQITRYLEAVELDELKSRLAELEGKSDEQI